MAGVKQLVKERVRNFFGNRVFAVEEAEGPAVIENRRRAPYSRTDLVDGTKVFRMEVRELRETREACISERHGVMQNEHQNVPGARFCIDTQRGDAQARR